jgi:hypothetical protein
MEVPSWNGVHKKAPPLGALMIKSGAARWGLAVKSAEADLAEDALAGQ